MPSQNSDSSITAAALLNAPGFWLGVDGGGTNCRAALADATGKVLGTGQAAGANLARIGLDAAVTHIQQAVAEACAQASINIAQISGACFGLAGVGNPKHHAA